MARPFHVAATLGILLSCAVATACQSGPGPVPVEYLEGTALDRNEIKVAQKTEYLEVNLNPLDSQLRLEEVAKIKTFLAAYKSHGHGPLIMSLPENAPNPQLAVRAVAEARDLAWQSGVEYTEIAGGSYNASGRPNAPMIMAFRAYDAIAPDCPSRATLNYADASSNADLPTLGCAIRTNMAAMIADPADLLGARELEIGDGGRRTDQLAKWREGAVTAAERSDAESAVLSSAVN